MIVTASRGAQGEAAVVVVEARVSRRGRGARELLSLRRDGSNGEIEEDWQEWRDR